MSNVLIIGATSAIAEATARCFAHRGDHLYLLARDSDRLQIIAKDLAVRGAAAVDYYAFDFTHLDQHESVLNRAISFLGYIDVALISHGTFPDQETCQRDFSLAQAVLNDNAISTLSMLTYLANIFEQRKSGTIAVVSSVAGDRGRRSNYLYGSSKAMVTAFLSGLRNRLAASGVHVLTIKPGYVDTPMTAHYKKGILWAQPSAISSGIMKAIDSRRNVVYLPWFWSLIMFVIRSIPEVIFKRTNF